MSDDGPQPNSELRLAMRKSTVRPDELLRTFGAEAFPLCRADRMSKSCDEWHAEAIGAWIAKGAR
jgi:hypothetical protein